MFKKKNFLKKSVLILMLLTITFSLSAAAFFTNELGVFGNSTPGSSSNGASLNIDAFYGTQIQFNSFMLLKGLFSVRTDNIIQNGLFDDTPAYFSINEVSLGLKFKTTAVSGQFSAFTGNFESPGSDTFVQRYLGSRKISSPLLTPLYSTSALNIYPISGIGFGVAGKLNAPVALGFYGYYNDKFNLKHINTDLRVAATSNNVIVDFAAGVSFPIEREDSNGDKVFLIIRRADLHGALSVVLGGNPYTNLFLQAGVSRIQIKPFDGEQVFSLDNLFVLMEPRFATESAYCSFTFFCLPKESLESLAYIKNPLGAAISVKSKRSSLFRKPADKGIHLSASVPNPAEVDFSTDNINLIVSPFTDITLGKATLSGSMIIQPLEYKDFSSLLKICIGYRTNL